MFRYYQYPYNGQRYLLNFDSNILHDIHNENANCQLDLIKPSHIKMFDGLCEVLFYQYEYTHCVHCCCWCMQKLSKKYI